MSAIKLTELTELVSVDNENTIIFVTDLSVSPNVSKYVKVGSLTQTDYTIANAAFLRANVAFSTGYSANSALVISNLSYNQSNISFIQANSAYIHANAAFNHANASFARTNSAFNHANSGYSHANSAFNHANASFARTNSAFNHANSGYTHANAAFGVANTSGSTSQFSYNHANSAFIRANNSVLKAGDTITGIVAAPTAANGTSNTMIATTQFVNNSITNAKLSGVPEVKAYAIISDNGTIATLVKGKNIDSISRTGTGRYLINITPGTFSDANFLIMPAVSTFNPSSTGRNFDHVINIGNVTSNSVEIDTGDARSGSNNTPHNVSKIWITMVE